MRTSTVIILLVLAPLCGSARASDSPAIVLDVQAICRRDQDCRVKVTTGAEDAKKVVVTTFFANRVGADMKYFKGEEYGSFEVAHPGLMVMNSRVALDEHGTMRAPSATDPASQTFDFTTLVSVDPLGRVTFFYGFLHRPDFPLVERSYLWGYPPSTVKIVGAIGGPRSPAVTREPPPSRVIEGGVAMKFGIASNAAGHCTVRTLITRGDQLGSTVTHFRANCLGEDMRYFPSEKEGSTKLLAGGGTYKADLKVVVSEKGGLWSPGAKDSTAETATMTSTLSLDDQGHVTFFFGFVRDPESSHVPRFLLWGYPPGTLMVDDPGEADDPGSAEPGKKKKGDT